MSGKVEMDVRQEHPGEPDRLCQESAIVRVREMLLETAKVTDPMAMATHHLDLNG